MVESLEDVDLPFVILRHELPSEARQPSHWDLMFALRRGDRDDRCLETWATVADPLQQLFVPNGKLDVLKKLPDHRAHYLSYEGAVSNQRGTVQRVVSGRITQRLRADDQRIFCLAFRNQQGELALCRQSANVEKWQATWQPNRK